MSRYIICKSFVCFKVKCLGSVINSNRFHYIQILVICQETINFNIACTMIQHMLMVYSIIVYVSVLIVLASERVVIPGHMYHISLLLYTRVFVSFFCSTQFADQFRLSIFTRVRGLSVCLDIQPRFHFPRGCVAYIKQFASQVFLFGVRQNCW